MREEHREVSAGSEQLAVSRDGTRIRWVEHGAGPPILLIMGRAFGSDLWYRSIPALAETHRVLRFDNRGVGGTMSSRTDFEIADLAADAAAVLDAARVGSAAVYAVSMGGLIAQELALAHPDRVERLVLGCTGCPADGDKMSGTRSSAAPYRLPLGLLWALAGRSLYASATPAERRREDLATLRPIRRDPQLLAAQGKAIAHYRSFDRVPAIDVPTLVLHGDEDKVVEHSHGERLAERIPGARLETLTGAGHMYPTDRLGVSEELVLEFLAGR